MRLFIESPASAGLFSCRLITRRKHEVPRGAPRKAPYLLHRLRLVLTTQVDESRLDARMPQELLQRDQLIRVRFIELNGERRPERVHCRSNADTPSDLLDGLPDHLV